MENKLSKKLMCIVLAIAMMMTMAIPVFAQDYVEEENRVTTTYLGENVQEKISPRAIGEPDSGTVAALQSMTLRPTLNSYIGFQRKFAITTVAMTDGSEIVAGAVIARLYDPNGNMMKTWSMAPEGEGIETFTLPKSGQYRLEIYNGANVPVFVTCTWMT